MLTAQYISDLFVRRFATPSHMEKVTPVMEIFDGFELVREQALPELNSEARFYRHAKTGTELLSLVNDDENKVVRQRAKGDAEQACLYQKRRGWVRSRPVTTCSDSTIWTECLNPRQMVTPSRLSG